MPSVFTEFDIIPPRKNEMLWKLKANERGMHLCNEVVRACQQMAPKIWRQWSGYHRCSLVETNMQCFKRLSKRVRARTLERQVAELQVRVA